MTKVPKKTMSEGRLDLTLSRVIAAPPARNTGCGPFFMTAIMTFEEHAGGTLYTALALHKDDADREAHEKMGFHEGWGKCADQLAALAERLNAGG